MSFEEALAFTMAWEGGLSDHKDDPGGLTNYGITQETYDAYNGDSTQSVTGITRAEAANVYKDLYWHKAHCDELPDKLALVVFDTAVNCGVNRAVKWLQISSSTTPDGVFGNKTREAVNKMIEKRTEDYLCDDIVSMRRLHYARIITANPKLRAFARGWENRMKSLERELDK